MSPSPPAVLQGVILADSSLELDLSLLFLHILDAPCHSLAGCVGRSPATCPGVLYGLLFGQSPLSRWSFRTDAETQSFMRPAIQLCLTP